MKWVYFSENINSVSSNSYQLRVEKLINTKKHGFTYKMSIRVISFYLKSSGHSFNKYGILYFRNHTAINYQIWVCWDFQIRTNKCLLTLERTGTLPFYEVGRNILHTVITSFQNEIIVNTQR